MFFLSRFVTISSSLSSSIENLNRKRKSNQLNVGTNIIDAELATNSLIEKNNSIELACYQLQNNIKKLKQDATKRGIDIKQFE